MRHKTILVKDKTVFLIIDVQEKIYKAVRKHERMLDKIMKLIRGTKLLDIPTYYTEQYPEGLGETVEVIKSEVGGSSVKKLSFSCSGADNLFNQLKDKGIEYVIVCGIESHVCVQQTVLDLLANGFRVNVPVDAISSRFKIDYETAVRRMEKHGAEITTVEAVLFELMETCKIPEFKSISSLIK